MAVTGRKPKDEGEKVTRHALTQDWVEVPDVPFRGCECAEADRPRCGGTHVPKLPVRTKATRDWWAVVSSMPHCVLWSAGDWQFALATARIHGWLMTADRRGSAQELRVRERTMGTTVDARRDLRIRYVPVGNQGEELPPNVTEFELDRRRRVMDGD